MPLLALTWRRVRLWQHGPVGMRQKESWAALVVAVFLVALIAWVVTSSITVVVVVLLVSLLAVPVLAVSLFDRRSK